MGWRRASSRPAPPASARGGGAPRQGGHRQLLATQRDLLAEGAADVGADHRDLRFRESEPGRKRGAVAGAAPGCRRASSDARGPRPTRRSSPRFQRQRGSGDAGRSGPRRRGGPSANRRWPGRRRRMSGARRGCPQRVVDQDGAGPQRGITLGHGGQTVVVDDDELRRVLCLPRLRATTQATRSPSKRTLAVGKRLHRDRPQPLDRRRQSQRRGPAGQVVTVHDRLDTRHGARRRRRSHDPGVGVWGADEAGVAAPGGTRCLPSSGPGLSGSGGPPAVSCAGRSGCDPSCSRPMQKRAACGLVE